MNSPQTMHSATNVLIINAGSSSIKFAIYRVADTYTKLLGGSIENIGTGTASHLFANDTHSTKQQLSVVIANISEAAHYLVSWIELQYDFTLVTAIGHRLVHGMAHTSPEIITPALLTELKAIELYDQEHLPGEINIIELFAKRHPGLQQVACFDTGFHTSMPMIAKLIAIPKKFYHKGIHRYGFHGLSYAYLMEEIKKNPGAGIANSKIILAHLGNGSSMAAVSGGSCKDTSMGFTPTGGLMMGTRSGDLDPGVAWYLTEVEKLSPTQYNHLINHESGLLGISGTTADMKTLINNKATDVHAAEAFELYCYQAKKLIGAYATVLEGLDTLVFSGGIGEHAAEVRSRICTGLKFLGIELNEFKNSNSERIISCSSSRVLVMVIPTNEQLMIAHLVSEVLDLKKTN